MSELAPSVVIVCALLIVLEVKLIQAGLVEALYVDERRSEQCQPQIT